MFDKKPNKFSINVFLWRISVCFWFSKNLLSMFCFVLIKVQPVGIMSSSLIKKILPLQKKSDHSQTRSQKTVLFIVFRVALMLKFYGLVVTLGGPGHKYPLPKKKIFKKKWKWMDKLCCVLCEFRSRSANLMKQHMENKYECLTWQLCKFSHRRLKESMTWKITCINPFLILYNCFCLLYWL